MSETLKDAWNRDYIHRKTLGMESIAGYGTNKEATKHIIEVLPTIFSKYNIKSILDAPCGDFFIMKRMNLLGISYVGVDIIDELIEQNIKDNPGVDFRCLNMIEDPLPTCDLVFCRDIFIHLSYNNVKLFIENCKKSNIKYLISSHYPDVVENAELNGIIGWRFLNLELPPFNFPTPLELIAEQRYSDKYLGLWEISKLYNNG